MCFIAIFAHSSAHQCCDMKEPYFPVPENCCRGMCACVCATELNPKDCIPRAVGALKRIEGFPVGEMNHGVTVYTTKPFLVLSNPQRRIERSLVISSKKTMSWRAVRLCLFLYPASAGRFFQYERHRDTETHSETEIGCVSKDHPKRRCSWWWWWIRSRD